ncbi:MAG: hypothetical protein GOP50_02820 [Candidatus Heimdallarchaeota archaeon]|nr:hypothetical protein [Candidatus Heimdallarchaeota archaeon]
MNTIEDVTKPIQKPSLKFAPWISAIIILIYSVVVQFLLITSMESAFDVVEDFFERWSSSWVLIEIPLPLILAVIFYYYSQHSRSRNINLFLFSITALGTAVLGIVVYVILIQFPIQRQYTDFIFILSTSIVSVVFAFISLLVRRITVKRKTLQ